MKIISEAQKTVLKILGKAKPSASEYRLIRYCVTEQTDDGILLFNLLTRELLLLTENEFKNITELDYLKEQWFLVPESFDDKKCADTVRWVQESTYKKPTHITSYTILTTTDCNARCFYCFEKGQARVHMREETALKVAEYIKNHCDGEKVTLSWFGGEPLYNMPVIDLIADELKKSHIEFRSGMTTNGYLFDDSIVKKAVENWNLKSVQITLDGTEEVYNKAKSYIYKDTNPYQVVLDNIERLLNAEILVIIRLNMDLYNADNLMELADELANRFGGKKGIAVYANHIFDADMPMADLHSSEEWAKRQRAMCSLEDKLSEHKLIKRGRIQKKRKMNHCMADGGHAVVIFPSGDIGLCEHHLNDEFIGNINREGFDADVVESWKERSPAIPECADCFYYPECILLKKCTANSVCYPQRKEDCLRDVKRSMLGEFAAWRNMAETDDLEDLDKC